MSTINLQDRAMGAIMGAYIGDALGLGPHWFYDLNEQYRLYGDWINDYTDPQPDRYHAGMKAGQQSQSGLILNMQIDSILTNGGYNEEDFCRRLDTELFPQLDGTANVGPGGFTSQSIREAWVLRTQHNKPWGEVAGFTDNTEAAERVLALAVRYATKPQELARNVSSNTLLTQCDETINAMTVAYSAVLGMLVQGHPLDENLSSKLMQLVADHQLPFHAMSIPGSKPSGAGTFASPDALLTPSSIARAAHENLIQPAWKVSIVYGMPCAVYHQFPACYYLAARYSDDFENAVLHAINGGGQNMARAMLTGALVGAQVGIQNIPKRFIDGLEDSNKLLNRAEKLAALIH
ncbi:MULTISPECIES: ADP-ribosylglycohydrolase family protein [Cycloclasticus]|jgi:ADP-ribosylglycohydrolase|uniref:ADP-ribosylglycohydrolase n=1 Tax=Cycloclasticus zancles 78-ME TaxID=1198232 RepID=S5TZG3_9GAMM|nr:MULTISPECIES: ADP-ribosylglycohydrolase family protein [Cycloclasticus]AGS40373.1 ADP-ribosylglycohydrolase [Cycloclasticus zancles 78-ME]MBV1898860.1 ADP-ribosylglycohydrolase family protein [Cycloclasticus sp.]MDF1828592.1 ADP-ribosylglycohydrolase family protein [Cycloclasticus pugetii]